MIRHGGLLKVEFYAEIRRETEKAFCFFDGANEIWIPKSQVIRLDRLKGGDCEVCIPEWLAKEKGIV
jgi:hypothetical protein